MARANFSGPLEDRVELRELLDTYSDAVTRQDAVLWASCWLDSDEARWMLPSMAEWAQFAGKTVIVDEWKKMMAQFHGEGGAPRPISQTATPAAIRVDGDLAELRCYTTEFFVGPDGRTLHTKGRYDDICVKRNGHWQFRERTWTLMELGDFAAVQVPKAEG